jgi:hypothetical protein
MSPSRFALAPLIALVVFAAESAAQQEPSRIRIGAELIDSIRTTDPHLVSGAPFRVYRFHGDTSKIYGITALSKQFVPHARVEASVGHITEVVEDHDNGDSTSAILSFRAPRPDDYLVVVWADSDSVASTKHFSLAIREFVDHAAASRAIAVGDSINGELGGASGISADAFYDQYTLNLRRGQNVRLSVTGNGVGVIVGALDSGEFVPMNGSSALDSPGRLRGISRRDTRELERRSWHLIPPTDTTYIVRVIGRGLEPTRYSLAARAAEVRPRARQVRSLARGTESTGVLAGAGDEDDDAETFQEWTYVAKPGSHLTIRMHSSDFDSYLSVGVRRDSSFEELQHNDDDTEGAGLDSRVELQAPNEEPIVIRASGSGGRGAGHYTLRVDEREEVAHRLRQQVLIAGREIKDSLRDEDAVLDDGSRYVDWKYKVARAGDRFGIVLQSKDFDTFLAVGWMENGKFKMFSNNDDAPDQTDASGDAKTYISRLEVVAPKAGEFIVRVNTFGPDQLGAYTLKLQPTNNAAPR